MLIDKIKTRKIIYYCASYWCMKEIKTAEGGPETEISFDVKN